MFILAIIKLHWFEQAFCSICDAIEDSVEKYQIASTEKTRAAASDNETKALLHLLSRDRDSERIRYVVVDLFNDVTGVDHFGRTLWDVQSKKKQSAPAEIGRELVTLFKNYLSTFSPNFARYILFLGGITKSVCDNQSVQQFRYTDMKKQAKATVRRTLSEEAGKKTYMETYRLDGLISDTSIDNFLSVVEFVVADKSTESYIRDFFDKIPVKLPGDRELRGIFNEVRSIQSAKKDIYCEGECLAAPSEALNFGKHLDRSNVEIFILERILIHDPFKITPKPFLKVLGQLPEEQYESALEQCQIDVAKQLVDKSASEAFWELFEEILLIKRTKPEADIEQIFNALNTATLSECKHMSALSFKFLISIVLGGLKC